MTGKEKIIAFLEKHGPATDEEIASGTKMNPSSARTRRFELEQDGMVYAVDKGLTKSNRTTYIWDLAARHYDETIRKTSKTIQDD